MININFTSIPPFGVFIQLFLARDINPNPDPFKSLNVSYANIRSLSNKYPAISKFIPDNDIDLFAQ